jgi:hypothetical protein
LWKEEVMNGGLLYFGNKVLKAIWLINAVVKGYDICIFIWLMAK